MVASLGQQSRDDRSLREFARECAGTQGMKLSREGDEDITWVVTGTILNREPATLVSPAASQAHKRDQRGYLGCKTPCRGEYADPRG